MRLFLISIISAALFIFGCSHTTQETPLGETFIRSLKENKFDLLKNYFPTAEFYKTLPEGSKRTDAEIKDFLTKSNDRLKQSWQKIIDGLKNNKVDLSKVELVESLIYDPFSSKNEMEAMVVVYKYNGRQWDDLTFIVSQWKGKVILLEIPNPTRAFTFYDESLKESNRARASIELAKPEFKKTLEGKVKNIIALVKGDSLQGFAENLVYRGDDESRKWKSQLNFNDASEKQHATDFMQRVRRSITGCDDYKTNEVRTESESEGLWIVLPLQCGNKTVSFAFLRINNELLLGDIDSEQQ